MVGQLTVSHASVNQLLPFASILLSAVSTVCPPKTCASEAAVEPKKPWQKKSQFI